MKLSRTKAGQIAPLTTMRAVGSICIVACHYAPTWLWGWPDMMMRLLQKSGIVVSFFYVLSGFVLTYTYGATINPFMARRFWWERFARVYPTYLFALMLTVPFVQQASGGMDRQT
jgi:peptidoglycan/LPS O-acetylase OafA/YrhL